MVNRGKGIFWVYSPCKYRNMDQKNNLQEFHGCWHGHLGPPELFQGLSDFNFPCWKCINKLDFVSIVRDGFHIYCFIAFICGGNG